MASLFKVARSPYWQVRYKRADGTWGQKTTKFRHGYPMETRQARAYAAELTQKELAGARAGDESRWEAWVVAHLRQRYATSPTTCQRYETSWRTILAFLLRERVTVPQQLTRAHVKRYIDWRQDPKKYGGPIEGIYRCGLNTALNDVKILRIIMNEAVQLGFVANNPCSKLGIKKMPAEEKRPFTDAEIAKIRAALVNEKEWMMITFEIAMYQALRLRQCQFPMSAIDWNRGDHGTITYPRNIVKGKTPFTHPIDSRLLPLLRRLRDEGREVTCEIPKMPSKAWWRFFRRIGVRGVSFHCTRVTWITRACLANVPQAKAMRFVNHGSDDVHRIYQKLAAEDIMCVPTMVALPGSAEPPRENLDVPSPTPTPPQP